MTFLPLARRELQVASRDAKTYLGRVVAPGVMFLLFIWLTWMFRGMVGTTLPGNFIFRFVSYVAFGFILFEGAMRTADSISREKRDDTLGLLFLTNLRGWDIVLGKLVGSGTRSFLGLLATIPVLAVTRLYGGVTWWEILRTSTNLLNTLVLSLCIGLSVSVWCRKQSIANGISALIVVIFAGGLPGLAEVIRDDLGLLGLSRVVEWFSPAFSANMAFASSRGLAINFFWTSIGLQFATSLLLLFLSSLLIERSWRVKPPGAKALSAKEKWEFWCYGPPQQRAAIRSHLLDRNPFFWLTSRDRLARWWQYIYIGLAIVAVVAIGIIYDLDVDGYAPTIVFAIFALDLLFRLKISSQASQHFAADRQSGALELILATPLSIRELLRGHFLTLRRNFARPFLLLFALHVLVFIFLLSWRGVSEDSRLFLIPLIVGYLLSLVGDMLLLPWIATWKTLRMSNPNHAPGMALIILLLLPWFLFGIVIGLLSKYKVAWWQEATPLEGTLLALCIWAAVGLPCAWHSRHALLRYFRTAACDRTNLPRPWFLRLFRKA